MAGPLTIRITVNGVQQFLRVLERLSSESRKALKNIVNASSMRMRTGSIQRAPSSFGDLRRSIKVDFFDNGMAATIGSDLAHASFVEFGTGPLGKATALSGQGFGAKEFVPSGYRHGSTHKLPVKVVGRTGFGGKPKFDVVPELKLWAKRHNLDPWAVAIAIKKRGGNKARPYLFPSFMEEKPRMLNNITRALGDEVPKKARS